MAQLPETSQRLIKIFVESGLDEIRRIEDQAIGELKLRSPLERMAFLKLDSSSSPRKDSEPTGNGNGGKDENDMSSQ